MRRLVLLVVCGVLVIAFGKPFVLRAVASVRRVAEGNKTVKDRVAECGPAVDQRLSPSFRQRGVSYPPSSLAIVVLKKEGQLELYASGRDGVPHFIKSYRVLAASGVTGPKLREGDCQVPEGIYRIESLNPNSAFHLSLRVGYPNEFDTAQAKIDGRKNLGGDIMIHGGAASIGCVAIGDEAAEDLFVLAARTGLPNLVVVLSPVDFRVHKLPPPNAKLPSWSEKLYASIRSALAKYPKSG